MLIATTPATAAAGALAQIELLREETEGAWVEGDALLDRLAEFIRTVAAALS